MEFFEALLNMLEVPFPLAFTVLLALGLYVLGNRIKKKSEDPTDSTGIQTKYKITKINLITGVVIATIYHLVNYVIAFGFVLVPCIIQYIIIGMIAGAAAAGFSTLIYEYLKNKLKLRAFEGEENLE
jgi:putative Mn2+ efflux pump MntP